MSENINEFYLDYVNTVSNTIEKDRYFKYLFALIQAGDNEIHQTAQRLHKVVDETWIATIEEAIDALNRIIEKPRRFLKTEEDIVPVGLAKKITADSVRHLSQNTQFISGDDPDKVQPTKILNISLEETYDLYENRFIYHLINRLVRFIDKRTDVIFWSTGDEIQNSLAFRSHVDDAYEQIDYEVNMTVKNLRSFADTDADNMETFMRIDRVRRMVMALKGSSFCDIMSGCQIVRNPIQRTNLLTKDPDYRKCYQLWHFLESYDDIGYTIEVRDSAGAFDQEYVNQLYANFITQYATFRSITGDEERDFSDGELDKNLETKEKKIIPKFIKEIKEVEVEDRNLPDVEIRRIFVEEVTEAQLAAEAKAEEALAAQKAAEESQKEAEKKMRRAQHDAEDANTKAADSQAYADAMKKRADASDAAKEAADKERTEAIAKCEADIKAANEAADKRAQEAEAEAQRKGEEAEAAAQKRADEAEAAASQRADAAEAEYQRRADAAETEYQRRADEAEKDAQKRGADAESAAAHRAADAESVAAQRIAEAEADAARRVSDSETRLSESEKLRLAAEDQIVSYRTARENAESELQAKTKELAQESSEKQDLLIKNAELEKRMEIANRMRASAEERAEQEVNEIRSKLTEVQGTLLSERDAYQRAQFERDNALAEAKAAAAAREEAERMRDEIQQIYESSFSGKIKKIFGSKSES